MSIVGDASSEFSSWIKLKINGHCGLVDGCLLLFGDGGWGAVEV